MARRAVLLCVAMGLAGGEHGAKAVLLEKYTASWKRFKSLNALREGIETPPEEVTSILDGNVVLMSAPSSVCTLQEYVVFFRKQVDQALEASTHVVVVFDEPEHLTKAKQAEQRKRDRARTKQTVVTSEDLSPVAKSDDWLGCQLTSEDSVRLMFGCRASRQRAIDLICCETLNKIDSELCKRRTAKNKTLTLDGIDWRGANRPIGTPRVPGVIGTDDAVVQAIERKVPIGEGDLKLKVVSEAVEKGRLDTKSPFAGIEVVFLVTIDTDSLLIELAAQARRVEQGVVRFSAFLCLKERAAKRDIEGRPTHSHYNVADVEVLGEEVVEDLFSRSYGEVSMPLRRKGTALFAMGMAACGCDFACIKGLRAREMIDILRTVCSEEPFALSRMDTAWGDDENDLVKLGAVLQDVVKRSQRTIRENSRRRKAAEALLQVPNSELMKVLWTLRYWLGPELTNVSDWGFSADDFASPEASP